MGLVLSFILIFVFIFAGVFIGAVLLSALYTNFIYAIVTRMNRWEELREIQNKQDGE